MSKLQVDDIVNKDDTGSVGFSRGVVVTGVMTATTFSGTVSSSTGSFSGDVDIADKIVHTGDTNTAIRFPAADTFTIETGGSERVRVGAAGSVGIGTDDPESALHVVGNIPNAPMNFGVHIGAHSGYGIMQFTAATGGIIDFGESGVDSVGRIIYTHSNDALAFQTGNSEALRIDSSGRLLVNTTSSKAAAGVTADLQIEGTSTGSLRITRNASDAAPPHLVFSKSGGTSIGSNTTVDDDDNLGRIRFAGADGTDHASIGAEISAAVDGTPGSNDMPSRLVFSTTADGTASPTERLRIDSSGRLLIGADTSTSAGSIQAKTQIVSSDFNAALAIRRNQNSDGAPQLIFFKNRGTSNSSNTVVQDDDGLGNIRFFGNDGTDFAESAQITARVDGTPGSNDMPGALEFKTSADGAEAPVVKFTIDSTGDCTVNDGDLVIGTNGHGIDFSADGNAGGMTSELLDDYEEGTFTPTANNFTVSGTSTLTGEYVKIGRQVTIGIKFANTGTIAHATSAFIGGLPFSMAAGTEAHGLIGMLDNANSTAFNSNKSGTQCKLDGEGGNRFFPGSFTTTSSAAQLLFGGTYISAS